MAGKRLREDPGVWWLDETALTASREPWPCRVGTSGASSTCEEESELHDKHHLLWKELNLKEHYLELGVGRDSSAGPEVEGINIVVESGSGKQDNIITLVEHGGQPTDRDIISQENIIQDETYPEDKVNYTHIPELGLQDEHLQGDGMPNIPPTVYIHQQVVRDGHQDGDVQREVGGGGDADEDGGLLGGTIHLPKQLVRRRFRLKVGVMRDGLLQPTVTNYLLKSSGGGPRDIIKTGSGISKRKVEMCTAVNHINAKRQRLETT